MSSKKDQKHGVAKAPPPKIPEGDYFGKLVESSESFFAGGKKYKLVFRIDEGPYFGTEVCRFLNRKEKYAPSADTYIFWSLSSERRPVLDETLNPEQFVGSRYNFHVKTTTHNRHGDEVPEYLRYSVIDKFYKRLESSVITTSAPINLIPKNLEPFTSNPLPHTHHLPPTTHPDEVDDYSIKAEAIGYTFQGDEHRMHFNVLVDRKIGLELCDSDLAYEMAYKDCLARGFNQKSEMDMDDEDPIPF